MPGNYINNPWIPNYVQGTATSPIPLYNQAANYNQIVFMIAWSQLLRVSTIKQKLTTIGKPLIMGSG